ncbi:hypothetical protein PPSIR1_31328 [Plesiocystis pacifica SIR-1]|uniref:Sortilin N-terminal domain-containing protein n=1 Tax=Plesiocystis pacifica SIR-1 TaxID=391625 RepID=A6GDC8_9BACT|nr:hypothetical protein [Plesiocystis pacifica]EDM76119.1 hypothetical protein PPSIR1_31328 [Plesiocystis pacifica SIR-1]
MLRARASNPAVSFALFLAPLGCGDDTVPADEAGVATGSETDDEVGETESSTESETESETTETETETSTETETETTETTETETTETDTTGGNAEWTLPDCAAPGAPGIAWSADGGFTIVPTALPHVAPVSYTFGLATLHAPNAMVMHAGNHFYRSEDAGCTWEDLGTVAALPASAPLDLVVGPDDTVYGWSNNMEGLVRWQGETIEVLPGPAGAQVYAVAVDPDAPNHLRIGLSGGKLQDSFDQGESWAKVGVTAPGGFSTSYELAFDPTNIDRAIVGFIQSGWWVTDDGGDTWTQSAVETPAPDQAINGFNVEFAPDGSGVVYAQGLEVQLQDSPKRIYRSEDSGYTFVPVVTATPELTLTNGTRMWIHPGDPDRLRAAFGTCIMGIGTSLYDYDHGAGEVTTSHSPYGGFNAMVASPADPDFVYIGLEGSGNMNGPECPF